MSKIESRLTVLLVLREYLANVEVVPGVARHREPAGLVVRDLLRREVLVANNGFLQERECQKTRRSFPLIALILCI